MGGFLSIAFFSIIAGLIYSTIIYITIPYKIVNLNVAFGYLMGGAVAIAGVLGVHEVFPWWHTLAITMTTHLFDVSTTINLFYLQIEKFIQIGFLEEFMKLTVFILYGVIRSERGDNPIATMFYMMMVSVGFGLVENIHYAIQSIGSDFPHPYQVLLIRSFTATIGHMVFGLITGFWVALGRIPIRTYGRSWFDVVVNKRPKLRKWIYTSIGLIGAVTFHGLYNFNAETFAQASFGIIYLQLLVGVLAGGWCFKYLTKTHNKYVKKFNKRLKVSK